MTTLQARGPNQIAKELGDALLQKTYTVDFLTEERALNKGEVPMYYAEGSHPAIIEKDMWGVWECFWKKDLELYG
ncbi:MAG TPA: hypothetical protein GX707_16830 [Epulopiscium sp.]|nr:hypothetical protein [Candidatus Epulonipiscium sp.]